MAIYNHEYLRFEIKELKRKLIILNYLFNGKRDDFDNIDKFARYFFGFVQKELQHSIILHIGRLFDKRKDTFNFQRCINEDFNKLGLKKVRLLKFYEDSKIKLNSIIDWRHNNIAHKNYDIVYKKSTLPELKTSGLERGVKLCEHLFYKYEILLFGKHDKIESEETKNILENLMNSVKRSNAYRKLEDTNRIEYGIWEEVLNNDLLTENNIRGN
jgi:uncharacterized protein YfkK (UPF0435 family)